MSQNEEISWAEIRTSLRKNHRIIMDPDTTERVLHMFKHAYRGESAVCMDMFSGLEVPVLDQILSAAKMVQEMAGHFKQEREMESSSEDLWPKVLEEPPDEELERDEAHDFC